MLAVKIQLVFTLLFYTMKEKLCPLVTESGLWFPQYFEETPVVKSYSIVPFIPAGKENILKYLQLETAKGCLNTL